MKNNKTKTKTRGRFEREQYLNSLTTEEIKAKAYYSNDWKGGVIVLGAYLIMAIVVIGALFITIDKVMDNKDSRADRIGNVNDWLGQEICRENNDEYVYQRYSVNYNFVEVMCAESTIRIKGEKI